MERKTETKFQDLDTAGKVDFILKERTPSPEQVKYAPTVEFLDPESKLTREERARVVAMGDRTAISYDELSKKVIADRTQNDLSGGEATDKTASFFQMYALSAKSSKEIAHTSILEQIGVGPEVFGGDPPIVMEGISVLAGLRDVCTQRYGAFEAFSSRGGIFPENYWRIPEELNREGVLQNLNAINREVYSVYTHLTRKGIEHYLQVTPKKESEGWWQYRWRILNLALDDSRQVTNGSFLNHLAYHPNSALALRETISGLAASELPETRMIAEKLRELAKPALPTLMKHTEGSLFTEGLQAKRRGIFAAADFPSLENRRGVETESKLLGAYVNPEAGEYFLASFVSAERNGDYLSALKHIKGMPKDVVDVAIKEIFSGMDIHDKPPKELETVQITALFELSVGAIYEFVRHRQMTHIVSNFGVDGGFTIPQVYKEMGLNKEYRYAMDLAAKAVNLVEGLGSEYRAFVPLFVTRAHIQPVVIRMSGADAFHFIKIRASDAAHPDIKKPAYELENFLRQESSQLFKFLVKK